MINDNFNDKIYNNFHNKRIIQKNIKDRQLKINKKIMFLNIKIMMNNNLYNLNYKNQSDYKKKLMKIMNLLQINRLKIYLIQLIIIIMDGQIQKN